LSQCGQRYEERKGNSHAAIVHATGFERHPGGASLAADPQPRVAPQGLDKIKLGRAAASICLKFWLDFKEKVRW
jgi:hypothetical protein